MRWVKAHERYYPSLSALYHIPNGGGRSIQEGARLKKEGVRPGMPDYCLPLRAGKYGALYIEMKRRDGGILSAAQSAMHALLRRNGNRVVVCPGWEPARDAVLEYLSIGNATA